MNSMFGVLICLSGAAMSICGIFLDLGLDFSLFAFLLSLVGAYFVFMG